MCLTSVSAYRGMDNNDRTQQDRRRGGSVQSDEDLVRCCVHLLCWRYDRRCHHRYCGRAFWTEGWPIAEQYTSCSRCHLSRYSSRQNIFFSIVCLVCSHEEISYDCAFFPQVPQKQQVLMRWSSLADFLLVSILAWMLAWHQCILMRSHQCIWEERYGSNTIYFNSSSIT